MNELRRQTNHEIKKSERVRDSIQKIVNFKWLIIVLILTWLSKNKINTKNTKSSNIEYLRMLFVFYIYPKLQKYSVGCFLSVEDTDQCPPVWGRCQCRLYPYNKQRSGGQIMSHCIKLDRVVLIWLFSWLTDIRNG